MTKFLVLVASIAFVSFSAVAIAELIWEEDFLAVDDWSIISDPSGSADIDTFMDWGTFTVGDPGATAAFGSNDRIPFDPDLTGYYSVIIDVSNCTAIGTGLYEVFVDQFDGGGSYLQSTSIFSSDDWIGYWVIDLDGFSFHQDTETISPKIEVQSAAASKSVWLDDIGFDNAVPEPTTGLLLSLGALAVLRRRIRKHHTP